MNRFFRPFIIFVFFVSFVNSVVSYENNNKNDVLFNEKNLDQFFNNDTEGLLFKEQPDELLIAKITIKPEVIVERVSEGSKQSTDRHLEQEAPFTANTGTFRIMDKIYGTSHEIEVFKHLEFIYQSLRIGLHECFYDNKKLGNRSIALLEISDNSPSVEIYHGWMSSSFSHLTTYSNYRYSLWLLRCSISDQE